jgi:hypothetical protein
VADGDPGVPGGGGAGFAGGGGVRQGKAFFSEEKKQKTFCPTQLQCLWCQLEISAAKRRGVHHCVDSRVKPGHDGETSFQHLTNSVCGESEKFFASFLKKAALS